MSRRPRFQSHYGLILSYYENRACWGIQLSIPLWSDFIAKFYQFLISSRWASAFNPTMVWFYPLSVISIALLIIFFQSHYGLILSYSSRRTSDFFQQLSIPLWSDFISVKIDGTTYTRASFQSHYGLILSLLVQRAIHCWGLSFNPTMVWFYRSM